MLLLLLVAQLAGLAVLVRRLLPGRRRHPPIEPADGGGAGEVTVLVAARNEAERIGPCLAGLRAQGPAMREALIVDSHSTDGTGDLVLDAARRDPRLRLLRAEPLPGGWVGKVWALQHGLRFAGGDWVLGLDADTAPAAGAVAGALAAARRLGYDAVSFSPCFAGHSDRVLWLQPALLTTLVYRCGAAGEDGPDASRLLANGQCFLVKRSLLVSAGGYAAARTSFSDDVTLARHLARRGARVGFLDGSRLYAVRAYGSVAELWREWGRSIDLKDSSTPARQWAEVGFLALVQAAPVPVLALAAGGWAGPLAGPLAAVNLLLLAIRWLLLLPLRASYDRLAWTFWISPLADPIAVLRIALSSVRRPRRWRGRFYRRLQRQ